MLSRVHIGDIGRVVTGKTPPSSDKSYFGTEYPFITPTDINSEERTATPTRHLSERGRALQASLMVPAKSTMVVCIGATIGKTSFSASPCFTNQQINSVITNKDQFDAHFVYYALSNIGPELQQKASGSATPIINKSDFCNISILLPPLPYQRVAGAILSTYDDLIENNQKRAQALRDTVAAIFNDCIDHPTARETNSGAHSDWPKCTLLELKVDISTGKRPKGGAITDGEFLVPSIGAENIKGLGEHDFSKEKFVPRDYFDQMSVGRAQDRDVAIYKDGAYIGRSSYFRDGFPHREFCVNEHVFLLRGASVPPNFLYLSLHSPAAERDLRSLNSNAAQPGLTRSAVLNYRIPVPPPDVVARLDRAVEPYMALTVALAKKNRALRAARDLLLPRLLSGDLDVSRVPDPAEGTAVEAVP